MNAVEIARQSALDRVSALAREVERLRAKRFPIQSANTLLTEIATHVERLRADVNDLGEPGEFHDDDELCLTIQGISSPVLFLHQLLHYLDKIDSPRLPFELVQGFEELTSDLAGAATQLLLKPDRHYNYYTLMMRDYVPMGTVAAKLADALPGLAIVGFPSAEADATLLHTLLFHEIGHVIYRRKMANDVRTLIEETQSGDGAEQIDTIFSWTEEVCCDVIALRLVGPSFWFAWQWYSVAALERASDSDSHPDFGSRSELMQAYVAKLCEDLPEMAALTKAFVPANKLEPLARRETQKPLSSAATALRDVNYRSRLFQIVDTHTPCPLGKEGTANSVIAACKAIKRFVPPGSMMEPTYFASASAAEVLALVFAAAWMFRIHHFNDWDKFKWDRDKKGRILSELTLAAVEGNMLVRNYAKAVAEAKAKAEAETKNKGGT